MKISQLGISKWIILSMCSLIFVYTMFGFLAFRLEFPIMHSNSSRAVNKYYDYAGITHVHSRLSTGSGTLTEIIRAAAKTKNDFLIFTDMNVTVRPEAVEGYRDNVLVVWGGEYSYLGGHVLAYEMPNPLPYSGAGQAQIYFADLLTQAPQPNSHNFLIAAHPFLSEQHWNVLNLPGLNGMEILNLNSVWRDVLKSSKINLAWSLLMFPFNPDLAYLRLFKEPREEIQAWDDALHTRSFIGVSGADSTAKVMTTDNSFTFPRYETTMSLTKNHVLLRSELTGVYASDRQKIMDALGAGNFYFSVDLLGDPKGFYFDAVSAKRSFLLGSSLRAEQPVTLTAEIPDAKGAIYEIVLIRDGKRILSQRDKKLTYFTNEPGSYRVMVQVLPELPLPDGRKWFPWIYSNAIRILPK